MGNYSHSNVIFHYVRAKALSPAKNFFIKKPLNIMMGDDKPKNQKSNININDP